MNSTIKRVTPLELNILKSGGNPSLIQRASGL